MNGQDMMFRENKGENSQQMEEREQQPQEQERKFHSGGGGGPSGYFAFGGSSKSSSTVCRPDPNNPGHQICKKVTTETRIDPRTGQKITTTNESEDSAPMRGIGGFFSRPALAPCGEPAPDSGEGPGFWSKIKGIFSENEEPEEGSGFIKNNYHTQDGKDKFGAFFHGQQDEKYVDPFDEFRRFSPFKMMREFERIFEDDIAYQQTGPGSFINTGEDDDEFMKEFFGIRDFVHDPRYHETRFGIPREDSFFSHHIDHPRFHHHSHHHPHHHPSPSFPNNPERNTPQPQSPPPQNQTPPPAQTAASKANAKIYDV